MTATPPAARARAPGRPRPRDRAPVPEGLREGRHGPHRVRWDARAGVWIVTAARKASLDLLGIGASVHF